MTVQAGIGCSCLSAERSERNRRGSFNNAAPKQKAGTNQVPAFFRLPSWPATPGRPSLSWILGLFSSRLVQAGTGAGTSVSEPPKITLWQPLEKQLQFSFCIFMPSSRFRLCSGPLELEDRILSFPHVLFLLRIKLQWLTETTSKDP